MQWGKEQPQTETEAYATTTTTKLKQSIQVFQMQSTNNVIDTSDVQV